MSKIQINNPPAQKMVLNYISNLLILKYSSTFLVHSIFISHTQYKRELILRPTYHKSQIFQDIKLIKRHTFHKSQIF